MCVCVRVPACVSVLLLYTSVSVCLLKAGFRAEVDSVLRVLLMFLPLPLFHALFDQQVSAVFLDQCVIFQLSWMYQVFFLFSSLFFWLNVVSCQPNWLSIHSSNSNVLLICLLNMNKKLS